MLPTSGTFHLSTHPQYVLVFTKTTNYDYLIVTEPSALPLPQKTISNAVSRTPTAGLNAGKVGIMISTARTLPGVHIWTSVASK